MRPKRDSNDSRKKQRERTERSLAKYKFKKALIKSWEPTNRDPEYVRRLKDQAHKLKESLIVKGVVLPVDPDEVDY